MESSRRSKSAKAGPKLERKYVEKHRRIYMKYLINQLYSMIPAHASTSKDTVAVPDKVHAAEKYIATLGKKLEKKKKHLEQLKMGTKKTKSPPQIKFHEMGPKMVVVLITGLDNLATFNNIIRLCHEEGVEVVYTSFQLNGNSTLQISRETKVMMVL
ncbi:transcription factor bHLH162-like [Lycium barbarum]|uniref:transcription factor bHLH162-like n=1 Tax=Lycium barbarum TaxID=112863 RepID=UPI00293ED0E3|nr:transcription factor bHLH162-like [Lycium barbarum]